MTSPGQIAGRVNITWCGSGNERGDGSMPPFLHVHDADTGELIPAYAIVLRGGDPISGWDIRNPLTIEITELVDEDGEPTRTSNRPLALTPEYAEHLQTVADLQGGRRISELSDEECAALDELADEFAGPRIAWTTRVFVVAGMQLRSAAELAVAPKADTCSADSTPGCQSCTAPSDCAQPRVDDHSDA